MANATEGRLTKRRDAKRVSHPVNSGATIFAGTMVSLLTSGGNAVRAGTASSGRAVGVALETVTGDGTKRIEVEATCAQFANSASTDEITRADIGGIAYIVDDQTVAKTDDSGARQIAGAIVDVDAGGVWVDIGPGAVGPRGPQGTPG